MQSSILPRRFCFWVGTSLLFLMACASLGNGFSRLMFQNDQAGDLFSRWGELRQTSAGQNPCTPLKPRRPNTPPHRASCYPPWSVLTAEALLWSENWQTTRYYFALLNGLSLLAIALWAYWEGARSRTTAGVVVALASLAMFANSITLGVGQYGILINGFLVAMLCCIRRSWQIPAGLMLGLAAIKPHLALPFALVLLARKQWIAIGSALGYLLIATLVLSHRVNTPLTELLKTAVDRSDWFLNLPVASLIGVAAITALAAGILIRYRNHPPLTLMAGAGVAAQLWHYHRRYDSTLILFLLIALGRAASDTRKVAPRLAFLIVGLSLWIPQREIDWSPSLQMTQMSIWVVALGVLFQQGTPLNGFRWETKKMPLFWTRSVSDS